MATHAESVQESSEPIRYKKSVLRVSIHCEGCKKKVRKILSQVPGVHEIDIDIKQQKAIVIGEVDAVTLLRKLTKAGKHADLWPEKQPEKVPENKPEKPIDKGKKPKRDNKEETTQNAAPSNDKLADVKSPEPPIKSKSPQEPTQKSQNNGGDGSGDGECKSGEENSGTPAAVVTQESSKNDSGKESKSEGKKPESSTGGEEPPVTVEKKGGENENATVGGGEKVESGKIVKKKKKKGQNGNSTGGEPSSLRDVDVDRGVVPPTYSISDNHVPPRGHGYYGSGPDLYNAPPVYAASYNTSYPSAAATASYYTSPAANSYVYSYTGAETGHQPLDLESSPRQPLDSFEMFSDENPNGCSIM